MVLEQVVPTSSERSRLRLEFLDGLRGCAALFVVLHHIWKCSSIGPNAAALPRWFKLLTIFQLGHYSVGVFIVLSGYCLMLPVTRSGSGHLPRGFWNYLSRRARRILPPYYVALLFSLLLLLIPGLRLSDGTVYSDFNGPDMFGATLSHFLLVHNLNIFWNWRINGPLWSVATEWQIYFLFPLLLLPLLRRFGSTVPVIVGLALGVWSFFIPSIRGACYWYIGLFAMGMASAELSFSSKLTEKVKHFPWAWFSSICTVLLAAILLHCYKIGADWDPLADGVLGLATASFLIYGAHSLESGSQKILPWIIRALSSRVAVVLGGFSYSLYLTHYPLLQIAVLVCKHMHMTTPQVFLALAFLGLPVFLGLAYLFHLAFERRFMTPEVRPLSPA